MKLIGTQAIITRRLKLRRLKNDEHDFYHIYNFLDTDERVMRYMRPLLVGVSNNTKLFLELTEQRYGEDNFFTWGITLKETDNIIGIIELFNIDDEQCYGEIGFRLAFDYWNHGYMKEALKAVSAFAFQQNDFKVLGAYTDERNIAAQKLLENCFFKLYKKVNLEARDGEVGLKIYQLKKAALELKA